MRREAEDEISSSASSRDKILTTKKGIERTLLRNALRCKLHGFIELTDHLI